MKYQQDKFINALLFFAKKTDPAIFGITKLLKLLFLSDFFHFQKYGRPILGDTYFHLPQGPVPSVSYALFNDTFNIGEDTELKKVGRVVVEKVGDYDRHRIEPLKDPNLDVFSKSEIDTMKDIADKFYNKTGTQMVKMIHEMEIIKNTAKGEEIDYKLILKDKNDKAYAESLEEEEKEATEALASL